MSPNVRRPELRKRRTEEDLAAEAAERQRQLKAEFLERQAKADPPPRPTRRTKRHGKDM